MGYLTTLLSVKFLVSSSESVLRLIVGEKDKERRPNELKCVETHVTESSVTSIAVTPSLLHEFVSSNLLQTWNVLYRTFGLFPLRYKIFFHYATLKKLREFVSDFNAYTPIFFRICLKFFRCKNFLNLVCLFPKRSY